MRIQVSFQRVASAVALALLATVVAQTGFSSTSDAARGSPPPVAPNERFTGLARVVDGDTLDVGATRVRLEGIDAPESGQSCHRRLIGNWACGEAATNFLKRRVEGQTIECENRGADKYGRTLAICFLGTEDINAALVREGLAWAFVRYSSTYAALEQDARAAKRGIWSTDNMPAWDYRRRAWDVADDRAPSGCAIKGNAGRNGLIYHMPWSPWYGRVRMDGAGTGSGKRWFCSEDEAIAAGYRAARVN